MCRIRGCCRICCTAGRREGGAIKRIADRALCWRSAPPPAQDFTCQRYRYKDRIGEVEKAKNRTKAKVRSKVEHVFAVMKAEVWVRESALPGDREEREPAVC